MPNLGDIEICLCEEYTGKYFGEGSGWTLRAVIVLPKTDLIDQAFVDRLIELLQLKETIERSYFVNPTEENGGLREVCIETPTRRFNCSFYTPIMSV